MTLPANHPLRVQLNDEVHARPPEPMAAPCRVSYIALTFDAARRQECWNAVRDLALRYAAPLPWPGTNHYSADLGPFRVKWECHTEFLRYTFIAPGLGAGGEAGPFNEPAINAVPVDWLAGLGGELMVAAHVALMQSDADPVAFATAMFPDTVAVGSEVSGGAAAVFTDFRIKYDGFSRWLVQDHTMTPRQGGRVVQRLLEIDTYRIMALLALPVAQSLAPAIAESEQEVAEITAAMVVAEDSDEPVLLERITRLAAAIDSRQALSLYRFSAADAYDGLVHRRIAELREERLPTLQTLQEFTDRRLAPAMNTCRSTAGRQEELSRRVARATQLLATRISVTRERQNQSLLDSMNRRVRLQLRLQSAVEGLSIAAVTYYIVGLVGYVAKGAETYGVPVRPELAMAVAIPVVAGLMALGLRKTRKLLEHDE